VRSGFPGFPVEGIEFFRALTRHNNRDWFQPRKQIFEEKLKQPMCELVGAVNRAMLDFAHNYVTDPEKAIYRIYRDTRFSKDKTPYKDHLAANFRWRGAGRHERAGYYFAISPKEVAIGGGLYMPDKDVLLALRQHIAENHARMRKILSAPKLRKLLGELQGEQLTRGPKGFPTEHPAADLLRFKQFILYVQLGPEMATTPALYREIVERFRVMTPFIEFLNEQ